MKKFFRLNKIIDEKLFNEFEVFLEKQKNEPIAYIIFDTKGGELYFATKIIELIGESKIKIFGIAYKQVYSAAIPIFLSTHARFGYEGASALIHRAEKNNPNVSNADMYKVEKQVFQLISKKLEISLEEVYKMANKKTIVKMSNPLGKKFFIGQ